MDRTAYNILSQVNISRVEDVPYRGESILARVVKVIDGDTVMVIICMGSKCLKLSVRVGGVDCPESLKRNSSSTLEVEAGKRVKDYVNSLIGEYIQIRLDKKDKYGGRYVGDIFIADSNMYLSEILLEKKLAQPYSGNKKTPWTESQLQEICDFKY